MIAVVVESGRGRSVIGMSANFDNAYRQLVNAWKRHDDVPRGDAHLRALADARRSLDDARVGALRARNF